MRKIILTIGFLLLTVINSNAQKVSDSIKIVNNNCATKLARDYMLKMGIFNQNDSASKNLNSKELLRGSEFENESRGVFLISPLSSHRRKLIVLKNESQIKILTFNSVSKSLIELIKFLQETNTSNEDIFKYLDAVESYVEYSKNTIKSDNKIADSDWKDCE